MSLAWAHFTRVEDTDGKQVVQCNHCTTRYQVKRGNTTTMRAHLGAKHQNMLTEEERQILERSKSHANNDGSSGGEKRSRKRTMRTDISAEDADRLVQLKQAVVGNGIMMDQAFVDADVYEMFTLIAKNGQRGIDTLFGVPMNICSSDMMLMQPQDQGTVDMQQLQHDQNLLLNEGQLEMHDQHLQLTMQQMQQIQMQQMQQMQMHQMDMLQMDNGQTVMVTRSGQLDPGQHVVTVVGPVSLDQTQRLP